MPDELRIGESVLPPRGRLIGVDYGDVRIGLAICDADRLISSPLETYIRRGTAQDETYFRELARSEGATGFVIGFPIMLDGSEGTRAVLTRNFATWLHDVVKLPVFLCDERFTTAAAEDVLWDAGLSHKKRKSRRDQLAAQMILQTFLDKSC